MHLLRFAAFAAIVVVSALTAAETVRVDRFGLHEVALTATGTYANAYVECEATAEFVSPAGAVRAVPLFWDGGATWRFRFSPDTVGEWTWSVRSGDAGLAAARGAFACVASRLAGGVRPMAAAPHHFVREDGTPFWWLGDTAWALLIDIPSENHSLATATHYLDVRAQQGFNVVHVMLLSEEGDGNSGGTPWLDLATERLNPGYWQEADRRIALANARGLTVGLALAWGVKTTREPYAWARFPSQAARLRYARALTARYSADNVYFLVAGEWHGEARNRPGATPISVLRELTQIGDAVRAADPHGRMIGIHPMNHHGSTREFAANTAWMSFADYQQNYRQLHERILLSRQLARPVVNSEYAYHLRDGDGDGKTDKENSLTPDDIRHASWDIVTAGGYFVTGFGTTYFGGHRDPGKFDVDAAKNDIWEEQLGHLRKFFNALEWWKLIPSDLLVTSAEPRGEDNRVAVTRASRAMRVPTPPTTTYWAMMQPGQLYVVYVRGIAQSVALQLHAAGGAYTAREFNPRTGAWRDLPAARFGEFFDNTQLAGLPGGEAVARARAADGLADHYRYTPPDPQDWIVVLRRAD